MRTCTHIIFLLFGNPTLWLSLEIKGRAREASCSRPKQYASDPATPARLGTTPRDTGPSQATHDHRLDSTVSEHTPLTGPSYGLAPTHPRIGRGRKGNARRPKRGTPPARRPRHRPPHSDRPHHTGRKPGTHSPPNDAPWAESTPPRPPARPATRPKDRLA